MTGRAIMKPVIMRRVIKGAGGSARVFSILLVLLAASVFAPTRASSEEGEPLEEGRWIIGLDFLSSHVGAEDPTDPIPEGAIYSDEVGTGGALHIGYGFSPTFMLRLYMSGAQHESTDPDLNFELSAVALEAVYIFRAGQPLRPYLFGGFSGFATKGQHGDYNYEATGAGATCGTGLYYFLSRVVALHFAIRGEFVILEENEPQITLPGGGTVDTDAPFEWSGIAGKFSLGVAFRF